MKIKLLTATLLGLTSLMSTAEVSWNTSADGQVSDVSNLQPINGTAAVVFIRPQTNQSSDSSTNISVNGRYLTSLQAGHYVVDTVCAGNNTLSAVPTKALTNDLTANSVTVNFDNKATRYYYVDVADDFSATLRPVEGKTASDLLKGTYRQAHQVDRTRATNCVAPKPAPIYVAPVVTQPVVIRPAVELVPVQQVRQAPSIRLNIHFDHDKSVIKSQYRDEIVRAASFLAQYDGLDAVVEGHTDSTGTDNYNQKLSEQRAQAVRQALISQHNIDPNRISAVGYGESRPVATNTTKDGRYQNRRVVVTISDAQ